MGPQRCDCKKKILASSKASSSENSRRAGGEIVLVHSTSLKINEARTGVGRVRPMEITNSPCGNVRARETSTVAPVGVTPVTFTAKQRAVISSLAWFQCSFFTVCQRGWWGIGSQASARQKHEPEVLDDGHTPRGDDPEVCGQLGSRFRLPGTGRTVLSDARVTMSEHSQKRCTLQDGQGLRDVRFALPRQSSIKYGQSNVGHWERAYQCGTFETRVNWF